MTRSLSRWMIGCGIVASVRSDEKAQEELENENLYRFIYTTGVSELQLSFRVDAMVVISTVCSKEIQPQVESPFV
jgi:hypothetical protein